MRNFRIIVSMAIATIVVALASCNGSDTDPIHGTVPVDTTFWSGTSASTYFPLDKFHELGGKNDTLGQRAMVEKYRKALTANVVRHYPKITDEKNIKFILGSGYAKDVKSGDSKTYSGKFKNELIIVIEDSAVKDTLFLACGNGMLRPLELYTQSDFGTAERWRFTIQKGEGLATYLPELKEWGKVATELKIPIKDKDGKVVSQEIFSNYLGKYESLLFEGDVIDLLAGKVYYKGKEVDFDRRQTATYKANAKAKAEAKKKAKAKAKAKPKRR
jgi:hypothetical protein